MSALQPLLWFLIAYPALAAALLLVVKGDKGRAFLVPLSALLIAGASIAVACIFFSGGAVPYAPEFEAEWMSVILTVVDVIISLTIAVIAGRGHKPWIVLLALVQLALLCVYEGAIAPGLEIAQPFYVDTLSVIMALIIGIIGTGITVYAIGYMKDFQYQHEQPFDHRPRFFAVMYVFLTGMYLIVFSNNVAWLFCGWEITTLCSFLLIGYTKTDEATHNAFRQIWMNLLGGLAFACANIAMGIFGIGSIQELIAAGTSATSPEVATATMLVATLLGFAACTKAAQMPFHTWLLGAMVAPTPTSALLHSSTMVKAGCFLVIRLSPMFGTNVPGIMLMLVGGFTFMMTSIMAITQSNAKRVLAYSTIANLGLIVACAGIGSPLAVWAAIFLLIFHAAAKSLLFLCVGTAEHHIGSRNIEDMDELFSRMPRLSRFMVLGMLVMFIAPFGMLISKWAGFVSFIESGNIALVLMLAFGSAATFFFWSKWIGKLSASATSGAPAEQGVGRTEWFSLSLMATIALACCFLFPLISRYVVEPWLSTSFAVDSSTILTAVGFDNLWLLSILAIVVVVVLLTMAGHTPKNAKIQNAYLSGSSYDNYERVFVGPMDQHVEATQRNWYMHDMFQEDTLRRVGQLVAVAILLWGVFASLVSALAMGGVL